MIFTAQAKDGTGFKAIWKAETAEQLHVGMCSVNHKGLMPLLAPELAVFRRLAREGKTTEASDRWVWEVGK